MNSVPYRDFGESIYENDARTESFVGTVQITAQYKV